MSLPDDSLESIRKLFPNLPEKELEEVREVFDDYLSVIWRIYERLEQENPEILDKLIEEKRKRAMQEKSNI
jgi:hypothetical protein